MEVDDLAAFFEMVKFLQNWNGNNNVVVFKVIDAGTVMEDNIGVEHENFLFMGHFFVPQFS